VLSGLLGLAALIAAIVVGLRLMRRHAVERAQPGRTQATAIAIHDYGEIEIAVRLQTCGCGGRFALRGESPVGDAERPLRVALLECRRCEREQRIFFDLSEVRH
jgi:hypothetical protein